MNEKLKILHVIHDDKFIDWFLDKFEYDKFENKIIYLNSTLSYAGKHLNKISHIVPFSNSFFELIEQAGNYKMIFFYNLDYWKSFIVNRITDKDVLLIWNFFGTELYNDQYFPNKSLFGELTKKFIQKDRSVNLKRYLRFIKYSLKNLSVPEKEINKAIGKIDYFAWYSREEYDYLKQVVGELPSFLEYPLSYINSQRSYNSSKEVRILLGNSRAPENNHFDAISTIYKGGYKGDILLPISYGGNDNYIEKLKEYISSLNINFKVLDTFMSYQDYMNEINKCTTAVFNSYRQLALGNLFMLLLSGAKLYLSKLNPSYEWLKNLGFHLCSIEHDLKADIEKNNLVLTEDLQIKNQMVFDQITNTAKVNGFLESLLLLKPNNCD